jgi:hypothetical protein
MRHVPWSSWISAACRLGWEIRAYLVVGQEERRLEMVVWRVVDDWSWGGDCGVSRLVLC